MLLIEGMGYFEAFFVSFFVYIFFQGQNLAKCKKSVKKNKCILNCVDVLNIIFYYTLSNFSLGSLKLYAKNDPKTYVLYR